MSTAMPHAGFHYGYAEEGGRPEGCDRRRGDAESRAYLERFRCWVEQIERATTAAALTDAYHHAPAAADHPPEQP